MFKVTNKSPGDAKRCAEMLRRGNSLSLRPNLVSSYLIGVNVMARCGRNGGNRR